MKKISRASLCAYILGMLILPLGVALMERADFGVSMVVAPAYVLFRFLSQFLPFVTFGMAEYLLQAVLLCVMMLVLRRFRGVYLFSFVTAVIYGFVLDLWMIPVGLIGTETIWVRAVLYVAGMIVSAVGVGFFINTTIPPEVYELFVKEFSARKNIPVAKVKTVYDCLSCLAGVVLSFAFFGFGKFIGVQWGTVICALINGWMVGVASGGVKRMLNRLLPEKN